MKKIITIFILLGILISCNKVQNKESKINQKEIVGTFLGAVLKDDPATMRKLANADYIQHNPFIPTGLEPFIQMIPILEENGTTAKNIRMFQEGNYVFMHNIRRNTKPFGANQNGMFGFK